MFNKQIGVIHSMPPEWESPMEYRELALEPVDVVNFEDSPQIGVSVAVEYPSDFPFPAKLDPLDARLIKLIKALDR